MLSGVCVVGKELVGQAAACGAEPWEGGELGGCPPFLGMWVGIWELSAGSKLASSNKHFDSSWKSRKANFSEGSGTVSQQKVSSWSCSEYNLDCKPKAAQSYYTHVHTIELRAWPLRPLLGDPYKIPLTKAALCASRGTPACDVKNGEKIKK